MISFRKLVRIVPIASTVLACGSDPTINVNLVVNINGSATSGADASFGQGGGNGGNGGSGGGASVSEGGALDGEPPIVCRADTGCGIGSVQIEAGFEHCPEIVNLNITQPDSRTTVIIVAASDKDGEMLSYSWTATSGQFSNPHALQTTYTCASDDSKTQTLTLQVSDGQCFAQRLVTVTCP
jgi:hypothetical protein